MDIMGNVDPLTNWMQSTFVMVERDLLWWCWDFVEDGAGEGVLHSGIG